MDCHDTLLDFAGRYGVQGQMIVACELKISFQILNTPKDGDTLSLLVCCWGRDHSNSLACWLPARPPSNQNISKGSLHSQLVSLKEKRKAHYFHTHIKSLMICDEHDVCDTAAAWVYRIMLYIHTHKNSSNFLKKKNIPFEPILQKKLPIWADFKSIWGLFYALYGVY